MFLQFCRFAPTFQGKTRCPLSRKGSDFRTDVYPKYGEACSTSETSVPAHRTKKKDITTLFALAIRFSTITTGPQPLPRPVLHSVRSSASLSIRSTSFLMSSGSCLRLLPGLPALMFPSITCFRRHSLRKMWPIQPSFFLLYVGYSSPCLSLLLHSVSNDRSNWSSPAFTSTTFQNFQVYKFFGNQVTLDLLQNTLEQFFGLLTAEFQVLSQDSSRSICAEKMELRPHFYWKTCFHP